ncbi:microtubule associated protein (MAP65/ASE1) family protein [Actinidia rufa]|uniref:Microtubule associated protein (MAP65/ASE1) family protein n=1 Tax=Actinidia rufa TaxID=165716 RepID=A0A7J0EYG9_9ERIC|nr:microtubule associated protein (MAP65/ASE1) family protein [Actinidia rufa]
MEQTATEVERLNKPKASRMKELVMKQRSELEDIFYKTHIEPDPSTADKSNALIDSGLVDPFELLVNIKAQMNKAKDGPEVEVVHLPVTPIFYQPLVRVVDIMDRMKRWLSAWDEENCLKECMMRKIGLTSTIEMSTGTVLELGRGAHIHLKRAERARVTINKIPVYCFEILYCFLLPELVLCFGANQAVELTVSKHILRSVWFHYWRITSIGRGEAAIQGALVALGFGKFVGLMSILMDTGPIPEIPGRQSSPSIFWRRLIPGVQTGAVVLGVDNIVIALVYDLWSKEPVNLLWFRHTVL